MIAQLEAEGDHATLARAYMAMFTSYWMRSNAARSTQARSAAVEHARQSGDQALLTEALMWHAGPLIYGPTDRDTAARWADEAEVEAETPLMAASVGMVRSHVALMDGEFDEARRQMELADEAFAALGYELLRSASGQFYAQIAIAAGDTAEAVRAARESWEHGGALGDTSYRPTTGAWLAAALLADGRPDEAEDIALEAEAMSAEVDVVNFAITRGVRARIAALRGDPERAEALAREGIGFALETDFPIMHALAYEALLYVAPDDAEARERMLECFRIKGYRPGLQAYS
jgi:ATP/maltotriose-dependent transcriptional regulator MalT